MAQRCGYEAMRADRALLPFLEVALAIAKLEPGMYELVKTLRLPNADGQRS